MRRDWKKIKIGLENPHKIIGSPHLKSRRVLWVWVNTKAPSFLNAILLDCTSGVQFYCADSREFPILQFSDLWGMRHNSQQKQKFQKVIPRGEMSSLCRGIPLPSSWSVLTSNFLTVPKKPLGLEGFGVLVGYSSQRYHILI